jgi:nicotinamidase-related amidase
MTELPLPSHFDASRIGEIYRVEYQRLARDAERYSAEHRIVPAADDEHRVVLLLVDVQNTFCTPGFELFVAGRSGRAAVDDNRRLAEFLYRNLGNITRIFATLDTHTAMQIFHPVFLVDESGRHPDPMTVVSLEDVTEGRYRANPLVARALGSDAESMQRHLDHYCRELSDESKYNLMVWPYHAMLGGVGHALVSAIEEAVFFHGIARGSQASFEIKGNNPLTEHYSVLRPEVLEDADGVPIAGKNDRLIEELLAYDAIVIAGQAKSHCVSWTASDLLAEIRARDPELAKKVYLLDDCSSPVVVPGVVDFTEQADSRFRDFAGEGVNIVRSTQPMSEWPSLERIPRIGA